MRVDVTLWKNIDPSSPDAVGQAYSRYVALLRADPYAVFLTQDVRDALAALVFSPECIAQEGIAYAPLKSLPEDVVLAKAQIRAEVSSAVRKSPLALLLSYGFTAHLADLVVTAIYPEEG